MSKNRIKGITVEINGDTVGLSKALQGVNKSINSTQAQLKDVEKLLKLDPTNTELLSQKQRLLGDAISETKNKLGALKEASELAAESAKNYDAWKAKYEPLKQEISKTEEQLEKLRQRSEKADEQLANGEISKEKYDKLQDKIREVLHFSVPDKSPLTDFEKWMPDFMNGLAKGIDKNKKVVQRAVTGVANAMKTALTGEMNYSISSGNMPIISEISGSSGTANDYYNNDNSRTADQTNNSPKSLSRLEIYRQIRDALKE